MPSPKQIPLPWNHNIHYHSLVLGTVPSPCGAALDAGCGEGILTQKLAVCCGEVIGIDLYKQVLPTVALYENSPTNISFVAGDVMTYPFAHESFDFIVLVATLHHLPLEAALTRLNVLLKPGGVLTVIGLYRRQTVADYFFAVLGVLATRTLRIFKNYQNMNAPVAVPKQTLAEIRNAVTSLLPGAAFKRLLLFRYSIVWKKGLDTP